jgi:hypothetical protein
MARGHAAGTDAGWWLHVFCPDGRGIADMKRTGAGFPLPVLPLAFRIAGHQLGTMMISTLRFAARPAALLLEAIGS